MVQETQEKFLEVAVAAPVGRSLTYLPPKDCQQPLVPGMRVLVPLGNRKVTGYVLSTVDTVPSGQKLKEVAEVLDTGPLFPSKQVQFFKWIARYFHYPTGEVIKAALPAVQLCWP